MAKIRPAHHYAHPRSVMRQIANAGRVATRASLKQALAALPDMLDHAKAVQLIRHGRPRDIAHVAIDWHHFRQVLRHPYERMARTYEAGAKLGEKRINRAFTSRGRGVRYVKGGPGQTTNHRAGGDHLQPEEPGAASDLAEALKMLNGISAHGILSKDESSDRSA